MERLGEFYLSDARYQNYLKKEFAERTELWHDNCRCRLIVIDSKKEGEEFSPAFGISKEITEEGRVFGAAGYLTNLEMKTPDEESASLKRNFIKSAVDGIKYTIDNVSKGFSRIVEFFRKKI